MAVTQADAGRRRYAIVGHTAQPEAAFVCRRLCAGRRSPILAQGVRVAGRLGRREAVLSKPDTELVRGVDTIFDHGGVNLQATDLMWVSRPAGASHL
jgi:hypothetical protein